MPGARAQTGSVYLVKASNDVLSFCHCEDAPVSFPAQMSCPWCGCGWMFSCIECRKCFIFARAVERRESLDELVERDVLRYLGARKVPRAIVEGMVAEHLEYFCRALDGVEVGHEYVILDGHLFDTGRKGPVRFEGWYARHDLDVLPQVRAREDPGALGVLEDGA